MRSYLVVGLFCLLTAILNGQGDFYSLDKIQEIRITFQQDNWAEILDDFYVAGDKERLMGRVEINGEVLDSVGIRYKGFSSVSVGRAKNPFNIKLDYIKDQNYKGIDKIKLGNVIHDPSFVREALSYEIARKYMPASEANFANVYVNGVYLGVYSNVEAVNKEFIAKHFNSSENAFFKGNPENLEFSGENSNLSDTPGMDTSAYFTLYDKESENGWEALVDFIQVLNNSPEEIETVLNVDRALWMHAFNYSLINYDSYIGYAQNFYVYQDDYGMFNPIVWDLNMSFGSYRLTDASDFFDGFNISQAKVMDPLAHINSFSVQPRPLLRNLFGDDTYRRMYLAHIRTIVEENFADGNYLERVSAIQEVIREDVGLDSNKFYSDESFESNVSETYTDLIAYPGLSELMDARSDYLLAYSGVKNPPVLTIEDVADFAVPGDFVNFGIEVEVADTAILYYRYGRRGPFVRKDMAEFNTQQWATNLMMENQPLQFYFYAENEEAGVFSPRRAAFEYYEILPSVESVLDFNDIVINEFMSRQDNVQSDEAGEYDDWIELYNTTSEDINLSGLFLSDKVDQVDKWELPDTIIGAGEYKIVWADEDGSQGPMHANFKLASEGEYISLAYADGTIMDTVTFGAQEINITTGRLPNGSGPFAKLRPTFQFENNVSSTDDSVLDNQVYIYPNPTESILHLDFEEEHDSRISVYGIDGKLKQVFNFNQKKIVLNLSDLSAGSYYVQINFKEQLLTKRFIKF